MHVSTHEDKLKSLLERLETERDELKVKLGLAKLEARDEWQELEAKIEGLRGRLGRLKDEAGDAGSDVGAAFELVADEVKQGFDRIRKLF
jgi:predicted  nucleic acid-binding Zn-ribbon protein